MDKKYENNGKGGSGSYKPSKQTQRYSGWKPDATPTKIKLIPKKGPDAFHTHWSLWTKVKGRFKNVICNCQRMEIDVPCVLCHYATEDQNPDMLAGKKDAITVLLLESFHKVPKKSTKAGGKDYFVYERCEGKDRKGNSICQNCDNKIDVQVGQRKYWSLGSGHKAQLQKHMDYVADKCGSCRTGTIQASGFNCPECGGVLADFNKDDVEDELLKLLQDSEIVCEHCNKEVRAEPVYECIKLDEFDKNAPPTRGCDKPIKIDPFDVEYLICTEGEKAQTTIELKGWRLPKPGDKAPPSWMTEPMAFPEFLDYMDLQEQSDLLERDNPFDDDCQTYLESYYASASTEEATTDDEDADSEVY